jgi:hypothetical protein
MIKARDLYTAWLSQPIMSSGQQIGYAIIQYEVRAYTDTRNLGDTKAYIIGCTQRLVVPNPSSYAVPDGPILEYERYPALLIANTAISDSSQAISNATIVDYFPRTLNTAVSTSNSAGQSTGSSTSQQYSSGSSTAQTNTFSASESVGATGDMPSANLTVSGSTATTTSSFNSSMTGSGTDEGAQFSNSTAMTIKDWGSYASATPGQNALPGTAKEPDLWKVTWVWGQEFPWNVIQFNAPQSSGSSSIALPAYVQQRLYEQTTTNGVATTTVYPPSELALFGIDFVSQSTWLVEPSAPLTGTEAFAFTHEISCTFATHGVNGSTFSASIDTNAADPIMLDAPLDLVQLALDPLRPGTAAILGFVAGKFDVPPDENGSLFAITSDSNDLLVRGSGFTGIMTAQPSANSTSPEMNVCFKLAETDRDVNLSLKHWVQPGLPCELIVNINGQIVNRFIAAPEAGSGGDNVTVISLRYKDITSANYCDYLQLGLNRINITVVSMAPEGTTYQILAIAVG